MALNACFVRGCSRVPHLDSAIFQRDDGSRLSVNLRYDVEKSHNKRECCCLRILGQRALIPVEDEKPHVAEGGEKVLFQQIESRDFINHVHMLPKPLTANHSTSSSDRSKVRIAYQGLPGAYSEIAALKAYPYCETVPCDGFEVAFEAVELQLVDKAVLPIENSVTGSFHHNYDLLLRHKLHIVREVQLQVNHCLLGLSGVSKEELKGVMSHPQVLAQCDKMLSHLGVVKIGADNTATAAKVVASKGARESGAIANYRAAKIYGLDILEEGIQDDDNIIKRFLVLAREPIIAGTDRLYKTSIVFNLEEGAGVLVKALGAFAMRNINLSKIETRPMLQRPLRIVDDSNKRMAKYFNYIFYIDFEASMADPRAQYALQNLQEYTSFLRVLGCYPLDKSL